MSLLHSHCCFPWYLGIISIFVCFFLQRKILQRLSAKFVVLLNTFLVHFQEKERYGSGFFLYTRFVYWKYSDLKCAVQRDLSIKKNNPNKTQSFPCLYYFILCLEFDFYLAQCSDVSLYMLAQKQEGQFCISMLITPMSVVLIRLYCFLYWPNQVDIYSWYCIVLRDSNFVVSLYLSYGSITIFLQLNFVCLSYLTKPFLFYFSLKAH